MVIMDYSDRPDWRLPHADSVTILLKQIPLYFEKVKEFTQRSENSDLVKGFVVTYRIKYITECNRGEKTGTQSFLETEDALSAAPALEPRERNIKKTQNLSKAISYVFQDSLVVEELQHEFTPELAKEINKLIGNELFSNAGLYRKTDAKPAGYNFLYLPPSQIEAEMNKLFFETVKRFLNSSCKWYAVVSQFLERFLFIHPFPNGNGRTARILVSALLIKYTLVPVSLFNVKTDTSNRNKSNEIYLKCLNEAHQHNNLDLLNSVIIESTFFSLECFIDWLDLRN